MDFKALEDLYRKNEDLNNIIDELDDFDSMENTDYFSLEPTVLGEVDELEKTGEIDILNLNEFKSNQKNIENFIDNIEVDLKEKPKKRRFLPWTIDEDFHLQRAFVNCAVLGFITLAFGYGTLFYILSQAL